jgi:hypothetical protein
LRGKQRLEREAVADAFDERLDRRGLVAGRRVRLIELERRAFEADELRLVEHGRVGNCVVGHGATSSARSKRLF